MHTGSKLIAALLLAPTLTGQGPGQAGKPGGGGDPLQGHSLDYWVKQVSSSRERKAREALLVSKKVGPQAAVASTAVVRATRRKAIAPDALRTLLALGVIPKWAVKPLLQCLNQKSSCKLAIVALGSMGPPAIEAKSALIRLAHVGDYRGAAFAALEKLGVDTIDLLRDDLKSNKRWRSHALRQVFALGLEAEAAVPELIKVLEFYPRFVPEIGGLKSKAAIRAAEQARREFKLRSEKAARDRALAAQILGRMKTPGRALKALKKVALDFDAEAAKSAVWALMIHGSREAVPTLTKAIDRSRVKNLEFLCAGLIRFGPGSSRAVLTLKKLARRPGKLGKASGEVVIEIERSLGFLKRSRSSDAATRRDATPKLLAYGSAVLPALVTALQLGDPELNRAVIRRLVEQPRRFLDLGAVPAPYPKIPQPRLDPVPFVPLLIEFIADQDQHLASACCRTLAVIGVPRAEHAIPALREAVTKTDKGARLRIAACHALHAFGAMSGVADSVFETYLPYIRGEDPEIVRQCIRLFGLLGERAENCVAPLIEMFDSGKVIANNSSRALAAIALPALPGLIKALRAEKAASRLWSVRTLGKLGDRAQAAIQALHRVASEDSDEGVRDAAQLVLSKIRPR